MEERILERAGEFVERACDDGDGIIVRLTPQEVLFVTAAGNLAINATSGNSVNREVIQSVKETRVEGTLLLKRLRPLMLESQRIIRKQIERYGKHGGKSR